MSFRSGFVGLVGRPNAGKSSLMNFLVKEQVSLVSKKPQATRRRMNGVYSEEQMQVIFQDAPGFLQEGRSSLTEFIAEEARDVVKNVDVLAVSVACNQEPGEDIDELIKIVQDCGKPWCFCVTKLDQKPKDSFVDWWNTVKDLAPSYEFSVTQPKESSVKAFFEYLKEVLPESPAPLYDPELFTTENTRDLAAEFIREPCFELLDSEIPYGLAIRIEQFKEEKKIVRIEASIVVEKESHKAIVIGKKGSMLKQIGTAARHKLEELVGQKVFLGLHVVHRKDWTKKNSFMKEFGYECP